MPPDRNADKNFTWADTTVDDDDDDGIDDDDDDDDSDDERRALMGSYAPILMLL